MNVSPFIRPIDRIVYKVTNLVNGKIYVGQDTYNRSNYFGSGKIIKNALKKYGAENFLKETICKCSTSDELDQMEIFWIEKLSTRDPSIGYNIQRGGKGQSNEEYLARMSNALSGEKNPMHGKSVLSVWEKKYGRDIAEQMWKKSNERRSLNGLGKCHSEFSRETCQRLSEMRKGKPKPGKRKKIRIDGVIYDSMLIASEVLGISMSSISGKCRSSEEKFNNYEIL